MKYLYRILRLFFCPHKWETKETLDRIRTYQSDYSYEPVTIKTKVYLQSCKYCGKLKKFEP